MAETRRERLQFLVFALLVVVQAGLPWLFPWFPTIDGPAHLLIADAMNHLSDPDRVVLAEYFVPNDSLHPNYLIYYLLSALSAIVPVLAAEKILVSVLIAAVPLALLYTVRQVNPSAGFLAMLGIPIGYNFSLYFGFYNFTLGIAIFTFWFGFWWGHRNNPNLLVALGHLAIGAVAFICHLSVVAAAITAFGLAILGTEVERAMRSADAETRGSPSLTRWLPLAAGAPVFLLMLLFFVKRGEQTQAALRSISLPSAERFFDLATASSLIRFESLEANFSTLYFYLLAACLAWSVWLLINSRQRMPWFGLAALSVGFLIAYLMVPFQVIVRWVPGRFMPYVFIAAIIFMAGTVREFPRVFRTLVVFGALVLSSVWMVPRYLGLQELAGDFAQYVAGTHCIAPNSTVLGLRFASVPDGQWPREDFFIQGGSLIGVLTGSVDVKNFQAMTEVVPLVFREERNAWRHLAREKQIVSRPDDVPINRYLDTTGREIDYVILWGDQSLLVLNRTASTREHLENAYDLVFRSEDGRMNLYHCKSSAVKLCRPLRETET